jgi:hypothetical protein
MRSDPHVVADLGEHARPSRSIAVLRTAQWALDGTRRLTSIDEFREFLGLTAIQMVEGARELCKNPAGPPGPSRTTC